MSGKLFTETLSRQIFSLLAMAQRLNSLILVCQIPMIMSRSNNLPAQWRISRRNSYLENPLTIVPTYSLSGEFCNWFSLIAIILLHAVAHAQKSLKDILLASVWRVPYGILTGCARGCLCPSSCCSFPVQLYGRRDYCHVGLCFRVHLFRVGVQRAEGKV